MQRKWEVSWNWRFCHWWTCCYACWVLIYFGFGSSRKAKDSFRSCQCGCYKICDFFFLSEIWFSKHFRWLKAKCFECQTGINHRLVLIEESLQKMSWTSSFSLTLIFNFQRHQELKCMLSILVVAFLAFLMESSPTQLFNNPNLHANSRL